MTFSRSASPNLFSEIYKTHQYFQSHPVGCHQNRYLNRLVDLDSSFGLTTELILFWTKLLWDHLEPIFSSKVLLKLKARKIIMVKEIDIVIMVNIVVIVNKGVVGYKIIHTCLYS